MKHTPGTQIRRVRIMILITKVKTNKILVIILAVQEITTKPIEAKETAIPGATTRTKQSMYQ